jgi:hypothetical protein
MVSSGTVAAPGSRANMSEKSEELQKQVQEKLAQCTKLLEECEQLAEEGGFEFSFDSPGNTYYPTTIFSEADVIEHLVESNGADWDVDLTPEQRTELMEGAREELQYNTLPEYTELGSWWMPSRNC